MVIVDTSVWVDYFADRPTPQVTTLEGLLGGEPLAVGDLILFELLRGIRREADLQRVEAAFGKLQVLPMVGEAIARRAAEDYKALRRRGVTVRAAVDCLIATFCIEHGHMLLHNDRDFDAFEEHLGLRVFPCEPAQ